MDTVVLQYNVSLWAAINELIINLLIALQLDYIMPSTWIDFFCRRQIQQKIRLKIGSCSLTFWSDKKSDLSLRQ